MAQAPVLDAQTTYTIQKWHDLRFTAADAAVVLLGDADYRFHHIWEAAATATALLERMINLRRHDELPWIGVEKRYDRLLDFLLRDQIAVANQHFLLDGLAAPERRRPG